MLQAMIDELTRLIDKYGGSEWNTKETANRIVELLTEHRTLIQAELVDVQLGLRKLTDNDFLGPKEREFRQLQRSIVQGSDNAAPTDAAINKKKKKKQRNAKYFLKLDAKLWKKRQREMRQVAFESAREERIKQRAARVVRKAMRDASVNKEGVMMNNEARRLSSSAANNN